ncbi:SDR family oxidoreductase [Thalassovita taeanensis]|uniref:NADP-dependent 3-hydroxy acid dehydrogenase YdfG n=1 Tax=Thalassovita taeanensis TaxID=657014 RepID=A0A1H9BAD0_9RHOB|nr:SDR family oxidoreductase [Thalassovita taeanensis]SEP85785.1 NADP-dependent 3-hydroxy acid dehydrogenase YdfG [Thalassovita taeanensis]
MDIHDQVVVVTGGANGIGKALCDACHQAGARKVVVTDIDLAGAQAVARRIDGDAYRVDVSQEREITDMIDAVEAAHGPIGLFCSNAGVALGFDADFTNAAQASNDLWALSWQVNVMAHVYAARALIPRMKARGGGYFLNTLSAAGLLSQVGSATYATTKHAAVGFAENLAITHRDDGIRVTILCPQGVDTDMLRNIPDGPQSLDGALSPEQVAQCALTAISNEEFLALPHPQVLGYMQNKTKDYDRWIGGMVKLQRAMQA